ncbi:unnamed protein product [Soboliphyme baturini]|uniref:AAA_8 domain-containing protein n=1 Tax=Soboliphyme baturini TaxID=241478 RepID=A0A183J2I6_9BILA|nr:unnamed protein product [Soboliphyme baturini]
MFSLRTLAQWTQGLRRYCLKSGDPPNAMLEVFAYEANRLFRDRLVNDHDRSEFDSMLQASLSSLWGANATNALSGGYYVTLHADVAASLGKQTPKLHHVSIEEFATVVAKTMKRFSSDVRYTDLALIEEFLNLCAQIDRVITRCKGSLLLVGRPGVGRRSAASLLAYAHQMPCVVLPGSKESGIASFKSMIKQSLVQAGINGEHMLLLLEDFQITDPEYIEILNSLLLSGEVPDLFKLEELETLLKPLRERMSQEMYQETVQSYFTKTATENETETNFGKDAEVLTLNEDTVSQMVAIANSVKNDLTDCPKKFVTFVYQFICLYKNKRRTVASRYERLKLGVTKLNEARNAVAAMNDDAQKKSKLLADKQAEADCMLQGITSSMSVTNEQKSGMESLKMESEKESARIEKQKKVIEAQLAQVSKNEFIPSTICFRAFVRQCQNQEGIQKRSM